MAEPNRQGKEAVNKILKNYLAHAAVPGEEDFLDYACDAMFRAYAAKTLQKNCLHECIRQARAAVPVPEEELLPLLERAQPDEAVNLFELCDALEALLPKQRRVVRLFYIGRYSETEIALCLGVSRQAVHSMHRRALAVLRRFYG